MSDNPEILDADPDDFDGAGFLRKAKRMAAKMPFVTDAVAMYFTMMDSNTPLQVRASIVAALVYFVMPLDLIPDIAFGIGYADDAAVIAAALRLVHGHVTPQHYESAQAFLRS